MRKLSLLNRIKTLTCICCISSFLVFNACSNSYVTEKYYQQDAVTTRNENPSSIKLIKELGCNLCHSGFSEIPNKELAPQLNYAGLKYNPAYLFKYLQNPIKVRHNIGSSRMPNFGFSEKESLALTLYLNTLVEIEQGWPIYSEEIDLADKNLRNEGEELLEKSSCLSCHTFQNKGILVSTDLSSSSTKFNSKWLKDYLVSPASFGVSHDAMPALFYSVSNDSTSFDSLYPDSDFRVASITDFLLFKGSQERSKSEIQYQEMRRKHKQIDADLGRDIYISQNCAACHGGEMSSIWEKYNAPTLNNIGKKLKSNWLSEFLSSPRSVRPFGYYPGSGSRMPNFELSETEVDSLIFYFNKVEESPPEPLQKLSPFMLSKAEKLLTDKLDCLGCHRLNGFGGMIGPDLTNVNERLNPSFIRKIIENPNEIIDLNIMPASLQSEKTLDLIINYLIQKNNSSRNSSSYLSLVDHTMFIDHFDSDSAKFQYQFYCASCHGLSGNGDGFNAGFLKTPATKHADATYMSRRPNSTLFDGIHSGGYILNRSNQMPVWGNELTNDEIELLISYMRNLCDCEEPEWAQFTKN